MQSRGAREGRALNMLYSLRRRGAYALDGHRVDACRDYYLKVR